MADRPIGARGAGRGAVPDAILERFTFNGLTKFIGCCMVGTEIQGSGEDLADCAVEIDTWRKREFRLPKLESGDNAPAISLAPGGEGFWESRDRLGH
jgi:hypothetical protein